MSSSQISKRRDDYDVGWIAALSIERAAATMMLDDRHDEPEDFVQSQTDTNAYTWGRMGKHNIVITSLPDAMYGLANAADTASKLLSSFPQIKFGLLVGIAAGLPQPDKPIRLGDVVVSRPTGDSGGVLQYDLGKALQDDVWEPVGTLASPPQLLLRALSKLKAQHEISDSIIPQYLKEAAQRSAKWAAASTRPHSSTDRLINSERTASLEHDNLLATSRHSDGSEDHQVDPGVPAIYYGLIASGNTLVKDEHQRIKLLSRLRQKCICLEMEAAGLMNNFPCLVIRGICDYADSSKDDTWQCYASSTAAAFAKEFLSYVPVGEIRTAKRAIEVVNSMQSSIREVSYHIKHANQQRDNETVTSLLRDLLVCSYAEQKNRNNRRVDGTCRWFLEHQAFLKWLHNDSFPLLWVSADPGCGKSVLARCLVDDILPTSDRVVCYFFFKDEQIDQRTATNALCALLHQFIYLNRHELQPSVLSDLARQGSALTQSFEKLWEAFNLLISAVQAKDVLCVFDALDECEEKERRQLITAIGTMKTRRLKFLMTSRPYGEIRGDFRVFCYDLPTIHLAGENETEVKKIVREIDIVIDHKVGELGIAKCLEHTEILFLQQKLKTIPHRTYLWVILIIDIIKKTPGFTRGKVRTVVKTLPATVDEAYEKILSRSPDVIKARRLLSIILVATRPLLLEEMAMALAIQDAQASLDNLEEYLEPPQRTETTIRDACGLFVIVVDSRLYLLHQTAKDFLLQTDNNPKRIDEPGSSPDVYRHKRPREAAWKHTIFVSDAHVLAAQSCIWFLSISSQMTKKTEFHGYAAINWMLHLREAQSYCHDSIVQLGSALCDFRIPISKSWCASYCEVDPFFSVRLHDPGMHCTDLMIASYFGLVQVAKCIIDSGSNIDAMDIDKETALVWAIREQHEAVVQLLLHNGADPTIKDWRGYRAFDWALSTKNPSIIKICLEQYDHKQIQHKPQANGIDDDQPVITMDLGPRVENGWTPLLAASRRGDLETVRLLLDKNADFTASSNNGSMLLNAALRNKGDDCSEITRLLLDRGAGFSAADGNGRTPLHNALHRSHLDIARLLLDKGADPNVSDNYGWTPLYTASYSGYLEIVRLLLDRGADINKANNGGWTPLHTASNNGHLETVRLLLDRGADINKADNDGWTPLHTASRSGHLETVRLLLDRGADINKADNDGWTPLDSASNEGHLEVVGLLLDKNVDADIRTESS